MTYSDSAIWNAYLEDEAARYAGMLARPRRALDGMELTAWDEPAGTAADLTSSDIDAARCQLAGLMGLDPADVGTAVLALTGGERDDISQANALVALSEMTPGQVQGLVISLAADLSAAQRRELAKRGMALEDGSFPIPDVAHLHSAAVLAASGHGDVAAARKLIRKMAAHFGVDLHSLPGFSQDDEDLKEQAQRDRKRKASHPHRGQEPPNGPRAGTDGSDSFGSGTGFDMGGPGGGGGASMTAVSQRLLVRDMSGNPHTIALTADQAEEILGLAGSDSEGGPLEWITRDHPEFFLKHDVFVESTRTFPGGKLGRRVRSGRPLTPATGDEDPTDSRIHAEVLRLLDQMGDHQFMNGKERPYGASTSYPPLSPAARQRAEQRQLANGRAQSW